jgi:hypothetical protein
MDDVDVHPERTKHRPSGVDELVPIAATTGHDASCERHRGDDDVPPLRDALEGMAVLHVGVISRLRG